jgi:hypothetical protein
MDFILGYGNRSIEKKYGGAACLFIDIAPVRDPRHIDGSGNIVNDVNDPVRTNTNPPFVIAALEFFAAWRPWSRL